MKTKQLYHIWSVALGALTLSTINHPLSTSAQGTAFTYQGRLADTANPVTGIYDLRFGIYDSLSGGVLLAGPVTNSPVPITNGLFTVTLDFGAGVFSGSRRWLDIGARTNGGGPFSPLAPRQELTPMPYAITAENVVSGGIPAGVYSNPVTFNNPSNRFCGDGSCLTNLDATSLGGLPWYDFWRTIGNAGTSPGFNFLGTTDNQPLEIRVNNTHALRIVPAAVPSLEGGFNGNSTHGFSSSAIVGGGASTALNEVFGNYGFIGSGYGGKAGPNSAVVDGAYNVASGQYSFVGAGQTDTNLADYSFIGAGNNNRVTAGSIYSFVGAGFNNSAAGTSTVVAGGGNNIADANAAAITGGSENHAGADHAYVGGGQANNSLAGYATVAGGYNNSASAFGATVGGGGYDGFSVGGNNAAGPASFIGGGVGNTIQIGATNSVIVGGRGNLIQTNSTYSTIGGGKNNAVSDVAIFQFGIAPYAMIGGGEGNTIAPLFTFEGSAPPGDHSVIGGGYSNTIYASQAVISGGAGNLIESGIAATIPGGENNEADGFCSFAAGQRAKAYHTGAFVWADSQSADFASASSDTFNIRAQNGIQLSPTTSVFCGTGLRQMLNLFGTDYGIGVQGGDEYFRSSADFCWFKGGVHNDGLHSPGAGGTELMRLDNAGNLNVRANVVANSVILTSDRDAKENFVPVDAKAVLAKVASLPITEWDFKGDSTTRHIGPMAQDFHAAFGLNGSDDKHLAVVDEGGVALAAIQGLNEKVQQKEAEIQNLKERNDSLEERLNRMEAILKQLTTQK